jgi:hypothetical protein
MLNLYSVVGREIIIRDIQRRHVRPSHGALITPCLHLNSNQARLRLG